MATKEKHKKRSRVTYKTNAKTAKLWATTAKKYWSHKKKGDEE